MTSARSRPAKRHPSIAHRGGGSSNRVCFPAIMSSPSTTAPKLDLATGRERVLRNVTLAPFTTFKIGGPADLFYEARSADDLAKAVLEARNLELSYFVLGLGANILIGDRGFRGLVIRNAGAKHDFSNDGRLRTDSGAVIKDLIQESARLGW